MLSAAEDAMITLALLRARAWAVGSQVPHCGHFLTGTYKPRVRCYDTYQLSLKFERCLDSEGKRLFKRLILKS